MTVSTFLIPLVWVWLGWFLAGLTVIGLSAAEAIHYTSLKHEVRAVPWYGWFWLLGVAASIWPRQLWYCHLKKWEDRHGI